MAGKSTDRNDPHPSQVGCFVEGVTLNEQSRAEIAELIGRALSRAEWEELEDWLAIVKHMEECRADRVPIRDTAKALKKLGSIARKDDEEFRAALARDDETNAFIMAELHKLYRGLGLQPWNFDAFTPEQLRAAVLLAQHSLPKDTAGRPEKRTTFAAGFVQLWRDWTGKEPSTSSHELSGNSADVECAQILAEAIGDVVDASAMAKSLRRARNRSRQIVA